MVSVKLHGLLGDEIGESWDLDVDSVSEALRAIEANTQKLLKFFYERDREGIEYRVLVNQRDHQSDADLVVTRSDLATIDIVPVPSGSGNGGFFKIIAGVFLIAAAVAIGFATVGVGAGIMAAIGASAVTKGLFMFGAALLLGGLFELVAGGRKLKNGTENTKDEEIAPSYIFTGPVNTIAQGNPVAIGYGRLRIGSQVVASGVSSVSVTPSAL
jgi:predicted phage tail protein